MRFMPHNVLRLLLASFLTTAAFIEALLLTQHFHIFDPSFSRDLTPDESHLLSQIETYVQQCELHPVPLENFAEMGHRLRLMQGWIQLAENLRDTDFTGMGQRLWDYSERLAASQTPFLLRNGLERPLYAALRSHDTDTKGIVIPVGNVNFELACHLVANLREVVHSNLPIQIAYAGEKDLSYGRRAFMTNNWPDLEMLDVLTKLNDTTLELHTGKYAIKPFAALASRFEKVILIDADAVFLQDPNNVFSDPGFHDTGAYLFHDRAIWAGHDRFHDDWWQKQFAELGSISDNIAKSRAMQEGFSEHGESGVVVLDKERIGVTLALLHTCWQNTLEVRRLHTYQVGYGDKESFWFGMEALNTPYTMEKKYAAALGYDCTQNEIEHRVCTTNIAHLDHQGRLLWWNGGLYHDKSASAKTYSKIPTIWMVDGQWHPADAGLYSTMTGSDYHILTPREYEVIYETIIKARILDIIIETRGRVAKATR